MNKLSLITLGLVLFVAFPVSAAPFLVCDPYEAAVGVTKFEVKILDSSGNVVHREKNLIPDPTGQYGFKLDLAPINLPDVSYKAEAKAYNEDGWSVWSARYNISLPHNQ